MPNRPPILEAISIERRASNAVLLDDISLTVSAGDRIALLGPSGSGKTVLLRALAMLDRLDAGQVRWHGEVVAASSIPRFRSQVIYLHQRPALVDGTVEANLRQPYSLRIHRDKEFDRSRIVSLLTALGRDEEFLSKRQRELSGGEAQLAALLRAIQLNPEVLLLDEPTAALDREAADLVEALITGWFDEMPQARTTVWVTHDRQQAHRVSTVAFQVRSGRVIGGANE